MTPIAVGVIGYDRIGKRVADAIALQPDFRLAGAHETDPGRIKVIKARGILLAQGELCDWAAACGVMVVCQEPVPALSRPRVYCPEIHQECPLFPSISPPRVWPEILAVAEFARIQATGNRPNSGEFGYLASCREILPHPTCRRRPHAPDAACLLRFRPEFAFRN